MSLDDDALDDPDDEWLAGLRAAGLPVRVSQVPRPTMAGLQPGTVDLLEASHAASTRRAYEASWADYCAWCHAAGLGDPYSTSAVDVANWVTSHVAQGLSVSYLANIIDQPCYGRSVSTNGFARANSATACSKPRAVNRPGFCIRSSEVLRGLRDANKEGIHA